MIARSIERRVVEQMPERFLKFTARHMRAGRAPLEEQLLVVKIFHAGSMADADDGGEREVFIEEPQHRSLTFFVERRRRFVHDDDLRSLQQQTGKGDALALAA